MNKLINTLFNLNQIEALSRGENAVNRVHPLSKLIVTLGFIIAVSAFDKYALSKVLLMGIYPVMMLIISDMEMRPILVKMALPIWMAAGLGIFNPLFDSNQILILGQWTISAGWISFLVLLLKASLTVFAAIFLVATTPIEDIAGVLYKLKVPRIIPMQLLLMFRYINVLVRELDRIVTAYSMRSGMQRALSYKVWGSLMGQLFMRTSARSVEIYETMQLRGFDGVIKGRPIQAMRLKDHLYMLFWLSSFILILGTI
jgi:cobalt/nickel transport system permease protein